ncbi:MAG: ribosomal protein S18-alanine N-acetyltransferase [Helicobacteraceae bacterium]|jgi:ribosomal-protein-alanine N-acetyltransferase|nr:ribosomal protein S18-alanine N-acetyltransferase [Helicobacteraceae bacterium]
MKLIRASIDDLNELAAFERRCFSDEDWRLNRRAFSYHLKRENYLIKAELNGALAGYALVFTAKNRDWARLYALGVDSAYYRRGIGAALLTNAIEYAKKLGKKRLFLEVRIDNAAAIALYKKFAFRKIALIKAYYPLGADGLKMNLEL